MRILINIIATIVTAIILFVPLSSCPVVADGFTIEPRSGNVGSTVTIRGERLAGNSATVFWDKQEIASAIPISQGGSLLFNLIIPPSSKGEHSIEIITSGSSIITSSSKFTVIPFLKLSSPITRELARITINGTGFSSFETDIKIIWDGIADSNPPVMANRSGSWDTSFQIPYTVAGEHSFSAAGIQTSAAETGRYPIIVENAQLTFTTLPAAKISPASGTVGSQIFIYGWGFRHNEDGITVTWDGEIIKTNITAEADGRLFIDGARRTTDAALHGTDTRDSLYVPRTPSGKHVIGVYGSSFTARGRIPDTIFEIIPQIMAQLDTSLPGKQVTITGNGFAASDILSINYDGINITTKPVTDAVGSFNVSFDTSQSKTGEHTIVASGSKGLSARATFTSTKSPSDAPGLVYPASDSIITAPESDENIITFINSLIGSAFGSNTQSPVVPIMFKWSAEEPGYTYRLQISRNNTFSPNVINAGEISGTSYPLTQNIRLTPGQYFWRVKYEDGTGSQEQWSDIAEFKIVAAPTTGNNLTLITMILALVVILLIIITSLAKQHRS